MKQAVAYIEEHYASDLNMAVVSNYLSMNYSLFSYSFKQYTGSNFVNYLRDIRMKEAKRLLAGTDMRIAEISQPSAMRREALMKLFKGCCGVRRAGRPVPLDGAVVDDDPAFSTAST